MSHLLTDLRYGLRLLSKRPAFTLLIVLILGLGIGANTAIFGLLEQVLLRPLPYPEPDRLVRISGTDADGKGPLSYPDFLDLRERQRVFESIALVDHRDVVRPATVSRTRRVATRCRRTTSRCWGSSRGTVGSSGPRKRRSADTG